MRGAKRMDSALGVRWLAMWLACPICHRRRCAVKRQCGTGGLAKCEIRAYPSQAVDQRLHRARLRRAAQRVEVQLARRPRARPARGAAKRAIARIGRGRALRDHRDAQPGLDHAAHRVEAADRHGRREVPVQCIGTLVQRAVERAALVHADQRMLQRLREAQRLAPASAWPAGSTTCSGSRGEVPGIEARPARRHSTPDADIGPVVQAGADHVARVLLVQRYRRRPGMRRHESAAAARAGSRSRPTCWRTGAPCRAPRRLRSAPRAPAPAGPRRSSRRAPAPAGRRRSARCRAASAPAAACRRHVRGRRGAG